MNYFNDKNGETDQKIANQIKKTTDQNTFQTMIVEKLEVVLSSSISQ